MGSIILQEIGLGVTSGCVNVSVANLYQEATYHSEIVSQALLGENVLIKQNEKDFSRIEMSDGYAGWISNYQWVAERRSLLDSLTIRSHFAPVFSEADEKGRQIRDTTIGCRLKVKSHKDGWIQVVLPDGVLGWVRKNNFANLPACSRQNVVNLGKEFLGYPYFWGGRSPKGFDCSGLTQRIFNLLGVLLPRDAWMQHRDGTFVSKNPEEAKPGDLYFFSEKGLKITHVAVATGNCRMIHARGYVRMNSLTPQDDDFSRELLDTFVEVRSYL